MQSPAHRGLLGSGLKLAFLILALMPLGARASAHPGDDPLTPAERRAWVSEFVDRLDRPTDETLEFVEDLASRARAASSGKDQILARAARARLELAQEGPHAAEDILGSAQLLEPDPDDLARAFMLMTQHSLEAARGDLLKSYETIVDALGIANSLDDCGFLLRLELREFTLRYQIQEVTRGGDEEYARLRERAVALELPGVELWMDVLSGLESERPPVERAEELVALAEHAVDQGRPGIASWSYCFAARALVEHGDSGGATRLAERALECSLLCGDRAEISTMHGLLAQIAFSSGKVTEALARAREALAVVEGRGYDRREHDAIVALLSFTDRQHEGERWQELSARQAEMCALIGCGNGHELEQLRASLAAGEIERLRLSSQVARERAEGLGAWRIALWLLALGLSLVAIALLYGRRRLAAANALLVQEMTAARAAEEERLELQQQIHQIERLQGLGLIAGGIAHDFNNLLVGVLGNADLLRLSGGLSGQDREKVLEIRASAERASALCRQLLAYAGKAPMTRGRVDLAALVRRIVPVLRSAVSHGVVIRNDTSPGDAWVEADESQLEQTLLNLVTNAKDAGARTVRLRVSSCDRALGDDPEPRPCVTLDVFDDGEGMRDEVRRRVFDPFYTTRFPGRGLGLAAVFGIVGKHGGEIDVESEEGRGARFELAFPRVDPPLDERAEVPRARERATSASETRSSARQAARQAARILVVDDEPAVRRLAARMLEALGMEAIGAADGETALRELERAETPFACVLLDVTMPGLDGPTVLARMRKMKPGLRIVLMSGHAERDVLGRCVDANPDALLPKPFGLDEFEAAVLPESSCTSATS